MTQQRPPGSLAERPLTMGSICSIVGCIKFVQIQRVGGRGQGSRPISNLQPDGEEIMKKRQLERMETQIKELHTTLKSLADDKVFGELIRIIRRPGFTRPAEAAFLAGLLDSMLGQAKNMSRLKQVVLAGAEKVELNPQPLPPEPPPRA